MSSSKSSSGSSVTNTTNESSSVPAVASVEDWKKKANEKRALRIVNLNAPNVNRPDANLLLKLDSNVKKNGQLVKRIRTLHELPKDTKKNIVKDVWKNCYFCDQCVL